MEDSLTPQQLSQIPSNTFLSLGDKEEIVFLILLNYTKLNEKSFLLTTVTH